MKSLFRRTCLCAIVAMCFFATTESVHATSLSSLLTFDGPVGSATFFGTPFQNGGEDQLKDASVSVYQPHSGTHGSGYEVGDVIWGVAVLSNTNSSGVAGDVLPPPLAAFVFSAEITSLSGPGSSIVLGPTATSSPYTLSNLLDSSVENGLSAKSIVTVLSKNSSVSADSPFNWTTSQVSSASTGFSTTNGWSWELTADLVGSQDFFHFDPNVSGSLTGSDRGALTVTSQAFSVYQWLPVDVADFGGTIHSSGLTLDYGSVSIASANQQSRGWTFTDSSTFYVNPTPEPSSLAALVGVAAMGLVGAWRRRRSK